MERLFRGDLDIVEGLLFVHLKPAFNPKRPPRLDFLRYFLAEYVRSEAFLNKLGKAQATPAGVLNLEDEAADEAATSHAPMGFKRNFLRSAHFFNKTFFFFCFFFDLFTTKRRVFKGYEFGEEVDLETYQR